MLATLKFLVGSCQHAFRRYHYRTVSPSKKVIFQVQLKNNGLTSSESAKHKTFKWQSPLERSVYLRARKSISLKLGTPKGCRTLIKMEIFFEIFFFRFPIEAQTHSGLGFHPIQGRNFAIFRD